MEIRTTGNLGILDKGYNIPKENNKKNDTFQNFFNSALSMVNNTDQLIKSAEKTEIDFVLGLSNSTHDLQVAQQKANIALQYTLSVRNAIMDSYKEIMNIQF